MTSDVVLTIGMCTAAIVSFFAVNSQTQRTIAIRKRLRLDAARKNIKLQWLHDHESTNRLLQTIYRETYLLAAAKGMMVIVTVSGVVMVTSGTVSPFYYHLPFVLICILIVHALKSKVEDSIKLFNSDDCEIKCD